MIMIVWNIYLALMDSEIDVHHVEKRVRGRVKKQMEKSQREYYLNEQMKAIQKELGDLGGEEVNELEQLKKKLKIPVCLKRPSKKHPLN